MDQTLWKLPKAHPVYQPTEAVREKITSNKSAYKVKIIYTCFSPRPIRDMNSGKPIFPLPVTSASLNISSTSFALSPVIMLIQISRVIGWKYWKKKWKWWESESSFKTKIRSQYKPYFSKTPLRSDFERNPCPCSSNISNANLNSSICSGDNSALALD